MKSKEKIIESVAIPEVLLLLLLKLKLLELPEACRMFLIDSLETVLKPAVDGDVSCCSTSELAVSDSWLSATLSAA